MKKIFSQPIINVLVVLLLLAGAGFGGYYYAQQNTDPNDLTKEDLDKPEIEVDDTTPETAFITETYKLITENYWEIISDEQLSNLYFLAITRIYGSQPEIDQKNVDGISQLVQHVVTDSPDKDHVDMLAQVVDVVLQNLQPAGRSRLYTAEESKDLQERVANIDPDTDLFATLDTNSDASSEEIAAAYEDKKQEIEDTVADEEEKQAQLAEVDRAYAAVGNTDERERYVETGVEPTITGRALSDQVYYVKIKQFSPTTVEDLQLLLDDVPDSGQDGSLIIDLRGNVGGAIDGLPYFLGPFIGNNQYAYQFFSQGETLDFKTKTDFIPQINNFRKMVVLIDGNTQSSGEVMAATLKKYNVGILVGQKTRGWGTVERVFSLNHQLTDEKTFSIFLVHSLTLDDRGKPIEGVGVTPHVDITQSDWKQQLMGYFSDQGLVSEIEQLYE